MRKRHRPRSPAARARAPRGVPRVVPRRDRRPPVRAQRDAAPPRARTRACRPPAHHRCARARSRPLRPPRVRPRHHGENAAHGPVHIHVGERALDHVDVETAGKGHFRKYHLSNAACSRWQRCQTHSQMGCERAADEGRSAAHSTCSKAHRVADLRTANATGTAGMATAAVLMMREEMVHSRWPVSAVTGIDRLRERGARAHAPKWIRQRLKLTWLSCSRAVAVVVVMVHRGHSCGGCAGDGTSGRAW